MIQFSLLFSRVIQEMIQSKLFEMFLLCLTENVEC